MVQSCSIFRLHELTMLFLATAVLNLIIMSIVYARFISWMIARFASHSCTKRMKMLLLWSLACIGT